MSAAAPRPLMVRKPLTAAVPVFWLMVAAQARITGHRDVAWFFAGAFVGWVALAAVGAYERRTGAL